MNALKIIGKVFAVIFSILYYFILTGLISLVFVGKLFSGNYYAKVLENIDLSTIKVSDVGELLEGSGLDEDLTLEDALVMYFTEGGVEEAKAKAIIENKEIRTVIGNFIGDYLNYTIGGEEPTIKREDVETILTNPDVVSVAGSPTEQEIDEIYNNLKEAVVELIENGGISVDNSRRSNEVSTIN